MKKPKPKPKLRPGQKVNPGGPMIPAGPKGGAPKGHAPGRKPPPGRKVNPGGPMIPAPKGRGVKPRKPPPRKLARPESFPTVLERDYRQAEWILGGNDVLDNCAAVAVANSLLLATGVRASDAELLELHDRCGPLSIAEALAAVAARGLGGYRPASIDLVWPRPDLLDALTCSNGNPLTHYRRSSAWPVGLVLGVQLEEPHAVTVAPGGLVTWGALIIPWQGELIDEAWEVTWA